MGCRPGRWRPWPVRHQAVGLLMSAVLEHAVRSGRIRSNPARGLALPRPRRRDHVFLTHGQLAVLADAAGRWRLLVLVLGYTGLRWGEATALGSATSTSPAAASTCAAPSPTLAAGSCSARPSRTSPASSRCPFLAADLAASVQGKNPDDLVFTTAFGQHCPSRRTGGRRSSCPPASRP